MPTRAGRGACDIDFNGAQQRDDGGRVESDDRALQGWFAGEPGGAPRPRVQMIDRIHAKIAQKAPKTAKKRAKNAASAGISSLRSRRGGS